MKKSLILFLICFFLIHFSLSAQKNKFQFHSINTFGLIAGESQVSTLFQTINGIQFSHWFSGIGIGIDNYRYRTLPLFIDARRFFGKEKRIFIYGDLGYDFPIKDKPGKEISYSNTYHFKGGIYTDIGIGFKTKFIKKSSLLFSLGHSYKQLRTQTGIISDCVECASYFYDYKFSYGRLILKTGLTF